DAMEGPTPVSALIHAATMVTAGVYLLTRTVWLFRLTPDVMEIVAWNGAFTALLAAVLACVQTDIKRVLAYSTVSQLGYMMAAIGSGFAAAGFLHLLTHGVFKALLFLGAGAVIHAVGTNDIFAMGGLRRAMPQTFVVFLVATLSLAGIPLFAGFFSKEEVLAAVWVGGLGIPFAMLAIGSFLTAFYMFRVVFIAFFGQPRTAAHGAGHAAADGDVATHSHSAGGATDHTHAVVHAHAVGHGPAAHAHADPHPHDPPASMAIPLWLLAALAMVIGVGFAARHPEAEFVSPGWITPLAIVLAVGGIALAWLTYERRAIDAERLARAFALIRDAAENRFWLDDAFLAIYRWVFLGGARLVGWIDRYVVDGLVNLFSAWTLGAGDRLRRMQSGQPQDYVYAVALGALLLIVWFQWLG